MMVVKTILVMCLTQYGYNIGNADNYTLTSPQVSRCVDKVTACYYEGKKDVFECLKASTHRDE